MSLNSDSTSVDIDGSIEESEGLFPDENDIYNAQDEDRYFLEQEAPRIDMASKGESSVGMKELIPQQDDTGRNSETQLTTLVSLYAFYKKTYTSGTISFFKKDPYTNHKRHLEDVKFIKINADDGDNDSILQQVAEGVVNKVWQLRHKNLLLSVNSGVLHLKELEMNAIKDAIADVLKGTCVVTDGTYDGVSRLVGQAVREFNVDHDKESHLRCPLIGIICLDRIRNKETIKEPWEVERGVFGIDSDGELFIVDKNKQRWTFNPASLTKVNVQRDGNTTTSPLTGDVHGNSRYPHFDVGDLVQIRNEPATWNPISGSERKNYTEATIGKIGFIVQVTQDNDLLIQVNGEQYSFLYEPDAVTLMTGEHFIDLLRTAFMKYELTNEDDVLVKAVMRNDVKDVYAIISQAYKDFMEFTSGSFGVDYSGNFFVVDANRERRTFIPDDLTKDGNYIHTITDCDFDYGDLVKICPIGTRSKYWWRQQKQTIGKVGTIVRVNSDDSIDVRVCGNIYTYSAVDLQLVDEGRFDLLKEHFKTLKPECDRDDLQQAVNDNNFKKVTAIIRKAYKDSRRVCEYNHNKTYTVENNLSRRNNLFVFVDNSTLKKFGTEDEFRAKLEKRISSEMIGSRMNGDFNKQRQVLQYPLVNLLFNDQTTVKTVKSAMDNDIPSVVVFTTESDTRKRQDSAIADRTHRFKEEMLDNISKSYSTIPGDFSPFDQTNQKEHLLAVINLSDMSTMLVKMIVDVVWKANSVRTSLLKWIFDDIKRRPDVLMPLIYAADQPMDIDDIAITMNICLIVNNVKGVEALVQQRVEMKTARIEASQYKKLCDDDDGLLKRLKSKAKYAVGWVMERVQARPVRGDILDWLHSSIHLDSEDELPYWEYMFIWSLLLRRHDIAKKLWTKTKHPLFMALIANNLCKAVNQQTDNNVLIAEMNKQMSEWTTTAIDCLNECYQDGYKPTYEHLKMSMPFWYKKSCLDLAVESRNMEFLAQKACQNIVEDVWNGKRTDDKLNQRQKPSSDIDFIKFSLTKMQAPIWKFAYNVIFQLIFLCLFAYVLLAELTPTVSVSEYVLMAWVLTILVEEFRQMLLMPGHENVTPCLKLIKKLEYYFWSGWNKIDTVTIIMFFLGFGLRFKQYPDEIDYARLVYAFDFAAFCIRLLYIFTIRKDIGPKLLIFKKMITDLCHFYVIMVVFAVAYAITSYSILYPGAPITWANAKHLIRRPYWLHYGDLDLDETEEFKDCTNDTGLWENGTSLLCPTKTGRTYGPIMMGVYLLFSNILLLNILIAMFNYTFTRIHEKSDKILCFQKFVVIQDYAQRPVLCPPLNVLYVGWPIYKLCQWCVPKCTKDELSDDPFHVPYDDDWRICKLNYGHRIIKLSKFMKKAQRRYLHKKESDNSVIETANEKLDHLKNEAAKEEGYRNQALEGIEALNKKVDGLETKAAKEEGYRNQALEGIEALNKKVDGLETKAIREEEFRKTIMITTSQAAKYEEEFRKTMMDTTLKVAKRDDEFQGKILDQLNKMKDSIDNLNSKMRTCSMVTMRPPHTGPRQRATHSCWWSPLNRTRARYNRRTATADIEHKVDEKTEP